MQVQEVMRGRRAFRAFKAFAGILARRAIPDVKGQKAILDRKVRQEILGQLVLRVHRVTLGHKVQEAFRAIQVRQVLQARWGRRA